eukprot:CAMPEP_0116884414 /NCGR_PEP_ID=MMETSP0463-20121206/17310_1 /TAXON_ID=181622 /ORGANISM="Strombidinopsis sp, Strain SopsisLIS2011" /LENGTH=76 /DNA_ID=CAMNT_0004540903 /DNA_START=461 /DNA_END=691 /DNA_ORIENTATION=-
MTTTFHNLVLTRFFTGMAQVQMAICLPIWVDTFAPLDKKSLWMTCLTGAVGLGMVIGYIGAATISSFTDWEWSFYV